jgi:sugar O-acyltransferase (sialic acid O-acetyltransferase NeuD family)
MKDIYIIGSGGFAREVYFLINDINLSSKETIYNFKGYIGRESSDSEVKIGEKKFPVFAEDIFLRSNQGKRVDLAIGIGAPQTLEKLYYRFSESYSFPNLIHPSFIGHQEAIAMGIGNIITAGCIFSLDIKIASFNIFNLNTTVGHDAVIGSYNVVNPGVNISGGVEVGNKNLIGTNATVLQNLSIGNNSILGAGAVLSKNLESNLVAVGIPAKVVKENF